MKKLPTFIVMLLIVASCKKKTEEPPSTNCRVKQISETTTLSASGQEDKTVTSFSYNGDGTVAKASIVYSGNRMPTRTQVLRYQRFTGLVVVEEAWNGSNDFKVIDSMTLDAQGRIVKRHFPPNGTEKEAWNFISYDNSGQAIHNTTFSADASVYAPDTVDLRYYWRDANIERCNYTVYEYSDIDYNVGTNNISLSDLRSYGQPVFKVSKLVKVVKDTTGNVVGNFTYELDNAQKIKKITSTSANGVTKTVTEVAYDCR